MQCIQVVTAGLDGAIQLAHLDAEQSHSSGAELSSKPHVPGRSTVSYRAVRWSSPNTFVAAGSSGEMQLCTVPACVSTCLQSLGLSASLEQKSGLSSSISRLHDMR